MDKVVFFPVQQSKEINEENESKYQNHSFFIVNIIYYNIWNMFKLSLMSHNRNLTVCNTLYLHTIAIVKKIKFRIYHI